jgi:membrane protein
MKIAGADVLATVKTTYRGFLDDDLQGRAAEVAYNLLFSVVPLLIFLTALSGFVGRAIGSQDTMNRITTWLFDHLPANTAVAVRDPIQHVVDSSRGGLLSVGALLALWGGKNAMAAAIKALNTVFDVRETRSWPRRTGLAVGLTIALGVALVLVSTFFLAGAGFAASATARIGLGDTWRAVWSIVRWPLIAVVLVVAVAVLYWAAPNVEGAFACFTPGSVLTVLLWAAATVGLGFYFANFAGYAGGAYGALGGVLAFIFWLYVMSLILLLGAELNAALSAESMTSSTPLPVAGAAEAPDPDEACIRASASSQAAAGVPRGTHRGAAMPAGPIAPKAVKLLVSAISATKRSLLHR